MTDTDVSPALISAKAALTVAEVTLNRLKEESDRASGDAEIDVLNVVDFTDRAIDSLKAAVVWLQMAQPTKSEAGAG